MTLACDRPLETDSATDNLPDIDTLYSDQDEPVIVNGDDNTVNLRMMRWGFPPIPGKKSVITNIRNLKSRWWADVNRQWLLEAEYRALVPFTAFAEPVRKSTWFAVPGKTVACFAGIWRPFSGKRLDPVPGKARRAQVHKDDWQLFAFLTTKANSVVKPVHEKAMPVVLAEPEDQARWLEGGADTLDLQRPLPDDILEVTSYV